MKILHLKLNKMKSSLDAVQLRWISAQNIVSLNPITINLSVYCIWTNPRIIGKVHSIGHNTNEDNP